MPLLYFLLQSSSQFFPNQRNFNQKILVPKVNTVRPITKNPQNKGGDAGRMEELTNQIADFKVIYQFILFCDVFFK